MKLTSYHKQAIFMSVRNDIPKPDVEKTFADMQAALVVAMSPAVRKLYKTHPGALATHFVESWRYGFATGKPLVAGDAPATSVLQPWEDAAKERQATLLKVENAIKGCRTRAQVLKMFPEFEKYLPSEAFTPASASAQLPALANVIADLTKLGWPKQGSKV